MVKSALLYADRVTLASPKVVLIASMAGILSMAGSQRLETVLGMVEALPDGAATRGLYESLRRKKRKNVQELLLLRGLEKQLSQAADEVVAKVQDMLEDAGAGELDLALSSGAVDLDTLGLDQPGADTEHMVRRLADLLAEIVAPSSLTYPMFDDTTGGLLSSMIREGRAPGAQLAYATQATLAARFVGQLDAFPEAPMAAVLEAREALRGPLIRFRAAIVEMETGLETTPLDENFERVAQDLYRQHVAPAMEELADIGKQLRIGSLLGRELISGGGRRVSEAALSFAAASIAELPGLAASALGVGADVAASVYKRRTELRERQKENRFLFLYEAEQKVRGQQHSRR